MTAAHCTLDGRQKRYTTTRIIYQYIYWKWITK
jgi:hypothetical protein